ncbi:hypothetical protein HRbin12_01595 [bacterium HR12]|nr:hypothetical protein HRbin12_01595 [bacterium HR12]
MPEVASEIRTSVDQVAPRSVERRYQTFHRPVRWSMNHTRTSSSPMPTAAGNPAFTPLGERATRALHVRPPSVEDRAHTRRGPPGRRAPS